MKNINLTLRADGTATATIEKAIYDILKDYNVHLRSGPRFIRLSIIADISIIIKMLNSFPQEGSSFIAYMYLSSDQQKRYVYSAAIQDNLPSSVDNQLKELSTVIADTTVKMIEAYGWRTEHFKIIHNMDEEYIPSTTFYKDTILDTYTSVQDKISYIVDTIIQNLDIYTDKAMVKLHYLINKGTDCEVELNWTVHIQYSEIFYTENYSVRFIRDDVADVEYAMNVNDFTDYMYSILNSLYRISSYVLPGEIGEVSFYIMNNECIERI